MRRREIRLGLIRMTTTGTIVLLGIGHTNAHVVRQWARSPIDGCRLVCVSPFAQSTYSGMMPGKLAGQFTDPQWRIDLTRLTEASSAELVIASTHGLDWNARVLLLDDHEPIHFDMLSIGVGSMPAGWSNHRHVESVVPIKPMQTFMTRLDDAFSRVDAPSRRRRVVIVGGGVASVELAFCLDGRFRDWPRPSETDIAILSGGSSIAEGMTTRSIHRLKSILRDRGIGLRTNCRVVACDGDGCRMDDGSREPADVIIWATGAEPVPLISRLGLKTDSRGFIATRPTLQSLSDERVFAVGDCGTVVDDPSPKAGVYAVRQSPILWHNLNAIVRGGPMRSFHPQADFLKLLNTGDGRAVLEYGRITAHAAWCWWLKRWIDHRFIDEFQ